MTASPSPPTPPTPDLWVVRTSKGERRCRREGATFTPAHKPWLSERLTLLLLFVANDFRARYRAQSLGVVWSLLQPLVMMGLLSLVFMGAFKTPQANFPLFLLIGLIVWQWTAAALNTSAVSFVVNAELVKRTAFPRGLLPISAVLSYGINAAVESLALLAMVPFFPGAFQLSWALLTIPALLAILVVCLCGAALAISVLNVMYRDVAYLVSTALLLVYWLTPVVYPPSILPERWRALLAWNPLGGVITGVRGALLDGHGPSLDDWARLLVTTVVVALAGYGLFRRYDREMLDHV